MDKRFAVVVRPGCGQPAWPAPMGLGALGGEGGATGLEREGLRLRPLRAPRLRRLAWVFVVAAGLSGPVWSLNLNQLYPLALQQDPTVRAAQAATEAVRERLPQALAQRRPSIGFSIEHQHNDLSRSASQAPAQGSVGERYVSQNRSLQLRQALYRPALQVAVAQAEAALADAEALLVAEQHKLLLRLAGAYFEHLLALDQAQLLASLAELTERQLAAARRALAAGSGIRTDIDEAQARLDMARAQAFEVRQRQAFTRRQLELMVGQALPTLDRLVRVDAPLFAQAPAPLAQWLAEAERNNPELQAMLARQRVAEGEVQKAEAAHLPSLDLVARITDSKSENALNPDGNYRNKQLGLVFNLPLYSGGQTASGVRQAVAGVVQATERHEALRRDLELRVFGEHTALLEGQLKMVAQQQAVRSAEQLVRSSQRAFEAGGRTRLDILNAEQQRQTALRDLALSRYGYLLAAIKLQTLSSPQPAAFLAETAALFGPAPVER